MDMSKTVLIAIHFVRSRFMSSICTLLLRNDYATTATLWIFSSNGFLDLFLFKIVGAVVKAFSDATIRCVIFFFIDKTINDWLNLKHC